MNKINIRLTQNREGKQQKTLIIEDSELDKSPDINPVIIFPNEIYVLLSPHPPSNILHRRSISRVLIQLMMTTLCKSLHEEGVGVDG